MEILNKNQRKTALWRLLMVNVFLIALVGVGLFAMHNAYSGQGSEKIKKLESNIEESAAQFDADVTDLQNDLSRETGKYNQCLAEIKNNQGIEDLEKKRKVLKKQIKKLKKGNKRIENDLDECNFSK